MNDDVMLMHLTDYLCNRRIL